MENTIITNKPLIDWKGWLAIGAGVAAVVGIGAFASYKFSVKADQVRLHKADLKMKHDQFIMQHPEEHAMFSRLEKVGEMAEEIATLRSTVSTQQSTIGQYATKVSELTGKISQRDISIRGLNDKVSDLTKQVTDLRAYVPDPEDWSGVIDAISAISSDWRKASLIEDMIEQADSPSIEWVNAVSGAIKNLESDWRRSELMEKLIEKI